MRKKLLIALCCMALVGVAFASCQKVQSDKKPVIEVFQLSPSTDGAAEFLDLLGTQDLDETGDTCYQVAPPDIREKYGFSIFKFDKSCAGYLLYEEQIYPLGDWFGGYGLTSFAVADINHDNHNELYFTFSSGSGMHNLGLGYFDTKDKNIIIFDESFLKFDSLGNWDIMLTNENGLLSVYYAEVSGDSFVDIQLEPQEKIGEIAYSGKKIKFVRSEQAESKVSDEV